MATLKNISIRAPGVRGLNTQGSFGTLDAFWALRGTNCAYDDNDRCSARNGWTKVTSSSVTDHPLQVVHVYEEDENTRHIISTGLDSNNADAVGIWVGTTTLTSKIGSLTPATPDISFTNFNGKVYGAQDGETLIEWDGGAGNFTTVTGGGTPPDGDQILAFSGRLWGFTADRGTLKWSALLDGSNWSASGAGNVDITKHLSDDDFIVGMAPFQGRLVVFCRESIVVFNATEDPTSDLEIKERIPGMGAIARDSIINVGTDVMFLDESGVRSLARSLELQAAPMREVSQNNRDLLLNDVEGVSNKSKIRGSFHASLGFYLLTLPSSNEHVHWYVDLRKANEDGTARMFRWNHIEAHDFAYDRAADTFWVAQKAGVIGKYDGYLDNNVPYIMDVKSGWMDDKNAATLVPKRAKWYVVGGAGYNITAVWSYNYSEVEFSDTFSIPDRPVSEWGIAEWGLGEWTGSDTLAYRPPPTEMTGAGHRLQIGWRVSINGEPFAVQSIDIAVAAGRTATGADDF